MKLSWRSLGVIGLLGGLGGAMGGRLIYVMLPDVRLPIQVAGVHSWYAWRVIIGSALHGAILAALSVRVATAFFNREPRSQWGGALVAMGLASVLPWIPLWTAFCLNEPHRGDILYSWFLPFDPPSQGASFFIGWFVNRFPDAIWSQLLYRLISPPMFFVFYPVTWGFGGFSYYVWLTLWRGLARRQLPLHLLMASFSGCLGMIPLAVIARQWGPTLICGLWWGVLVGFGVWTTCKSN
ncbi:MAG: hypothetical protein HY737_05035 [Candidatus Omnitrophica bacterium]|nr:hypothetical protein [Candidatus Omnitrophota bacterium]